MQYNFYIIAVNQHDLTPALVLDQRGSQSHSEPPSITSDRVETFIDYLRRSTGAPACFAPDLDATKRMIDDCLTVAFNALRKNGDVQSRPQLVIELKKAGVAIWLTLKATGVRA